jgi:hypothetical protein
LFSFGGRWVGNFEVGVEGSAVDEHKKTRHKSVRTRHIITVATRRLIRKSTAVQSCLATG